MQSASDECATVGIRGRGRPRDPDVDRQVIEAAIELISEHGVDKLTMDAVAKHAGVAKASVYRRFPSKVELVVAACHAAVPYEPDLPESGSLTDDLVTLLGNLGRKLETSRSGRLMPAMVAASGTNPEVREALARFAASRRSNLRALLERGVERGDLRADADVDLLVDCLVGPVIYRHLIGGAPMQSAVRRLVDQVLRGVAP